LIGGGFIDIGEVGAVHTLHALDTVDFRRISWHWRIITLFWKRRPVGGLATVNLTVPNCCLSIDQRADVNGRERQRLFVAN
jgi:hypothetical protein